MPAARRFPPPWTAEETDACFVVRDANGQTYVYFEDEPSVPDVQISRFLPTVGCPFAHARRSAAGTGSLRKRVLDRRCFIVRDANGQALAYVYFEEEPGRRSAGTSSPATRLGASP
jgi:hypothetical protein